MLESSVYLRDSTRMTADPFSDIVRLTKAEAILTGGFSAGGPWAIRFPAREKIKFFAVIKGACWVHLDAITDAQHFVAGDVGLLAAQRSFVLSSAPGVPAVDAASLFSAVGRTTATLGDGADFVHIGGHVTLDPLRGKLLANVLPPWIHIQAATPQAITFRWLLEQLVHEKANELPGAQVAIAELTQLLFIQVLRAQLNVSTHLPAGWLRALGDPRIAPALHLMHGEPSRAWSLGELAKACAMSRTTFASHFKIVAGVAPLTYLTQWRMRLAEHALKENRDAIAEIARAIGYASESAFSNAFKRETGQSPRGYRNTST
jgi:AraC-like DNA-binding protein